MTTRCLYLALSTGQNIANVLPILELAEPGDRVLWIESATAARRGWSEGALQVLADQYGADVIRETLVDDEPASVFRLLAGHPALATAERRCLILNGGTKPQMLAAQAALGPVGLEWAYNLEAPCGLERFPAGAADTARPAVYARHRVDLPDILRCGGREIERGTGERIWPGVWREPAPSYGRDPALTAATHAAWHVYKRWGKVQEGQEHEECLEKAAARNPELATRVPYDELPTLVPKRMRSFKRVIGRGREVNDVMAREIYNSSQGLALAGREAWLRRGVQSPPDVGMDFEGAVRARVLGWLDGRPDYAGLMQSVWRNVKVCRSEDQRGSLAEIDCGLVLRNGVVLNLECKSYEADLKDLNSRLAELQRAASRPAEMAVCMPLFTGFADQGWFAPMAARAEKLRAWRYFQLLPFTLEGQPESYKDFRGEEVRVDTFEQALEAWLRRYLPPGSRR